MSIPRYTVRKMRQKVYTHGSEDAETTLCGLTTDSDWIVATNEFDGQIICPKCLKEVKEEFDPNWVIRWVEQGQIEGSHATVECRAEDVVKWQRKSYEEKCKNHEQGLDETKLAKLKKLTDMEVLDDFCVVFGGWITKGEVETYPVCSTLNCESKWRD